MDPTPQQPSTNPYDFITNPAQQPKQKGFGGGNSLRNRILIVVGGLTILIILVSAVGAILSNLGKAETNTLKDIIAQQQELIRVAELGADKSQSSQARALAYTAKMSVTTEKQKLTEYLNGRGIKMTAIELSSKKKSSVDTELDSAAANNRFDDAFTEVLNESLTNYSNSMKSAYQSTKGEKAKALLSESYASSTTLLGIK